MRDNEEHLRGIANDLLANAPLDYEDMRRVMDYMRELIEWHRRPLLFPIGRDRIDDS
jgi:hypothetical protein